MYSCIFFDLDHTLWDYETNSKETLEELYHTFSLKEKGVIDIDSFYNRFKEVNFNLWELYDRGLITSDVIRKERFKQVLEPFGAYEEKLSEDISRDYLTICPQKGNLMPNALEAVSYLADKYDLTVVTNGFDEIQHIKLSSGKLTPFFDHIITSQRAGHKKPAKEIFEYAMNLNGIKSNQTIMIGDNLITDMGGARNASIDTVYFNPFAVKHNDKVKHEINDLKELCSLL